MGMLSFGGGRSYDEFKRQITPSSLPVFEELRNFRISLNQNVVEDVRMHRIVFGKSMTFRWFADVEPQEEGVIVKIQKNRKESPKIVNIKLEQELDSTKGLISNAYESI